MIVKGDDATVSRIQVHLAMQAKGFYDADRTMAARKNNRAGGQISGLIIQMGFKCGIVGLPNVGKSTRCSTR